MVAPLPGLGRWGKSRYGCLVGILLFVAAWYYGIDVGAVYLRYWRMREEMRSVARFANRLDDATMQRRLHAKAEELDLPTQAHRFTIRRSARPREIRISTSYTEVVALPFARYTIRLNPVARAPL
ncbi:MAG: hypothetical protein HYT81_00485 [Gemmatimonadetes bacterium]|nr:hypothetical protein [Gemmatimonadota bacterium]MBI2401299.1 hypothetical protein [Gemmatimonadota bacterium]MBI3082005.1 hypothetical protein [Gemmatimonadota bacterium]